MLVLILAVVLYFILAGLISWMVLFPGGREWMLQALNGAGSGVWRRCTWLAARQRSGAGALRLACGSWWRRTLALLRQHRVLCLGGGALICLPPLAALLFGAGTRLSGFDAETREVNTQVAGLLQGEQLVPPPALPPLVFAAAEAQLERPMLMSASRDWALIHAAYAQRLLAAFRIMKERYGYDMAILEGYRSPERQNKLAAMGASVTGAAAFQSWHQYGLAADCAFVRDGKLVISERDPWAMRGYRLYGEVAESLGLTWGGRWKMMDFGHTELRLPGVMKR